MQTAQSESLAPVAQADPCASGDVIALPDVFFDVVTGSDASRVITTGADASHHISLFSNGTLLSDGEIVGRVEPSGCVRDGEGRLVAKWTENGELLWSAADGGFVRDECYRVALSRDTLVTDTCVGLDRTMVGFVDRQIRRTRVFCGDDLCERPIIGRSVEGGVRVYPTYAERRLALLLLLLPDAIRITAWHVVE